MLILVGVLYFLLTVWLLLWGIRIELVSHYVSKRIKEVYSSTNWFKYDIDMGDAYWRAMWDFRKWTYRSFFPEAVE